MTINFFQVILKIYKISYNETNITQKKTNNSPNFYSYLPEENIFVPTFVFRIWRPFVHGLGPIDYDYSYNAIFT